MGGAIFLIVLAIMVGVVIIASAVGRSSKSGPQRHRGGHDSGSANNYGMGWGGSSSDSGYSGGGSTGGGSGSSDCGPSSNYSDSGSSYSGDSGGGGGDCGGGGGGGE
jgi:hypothetical protein